MQRNSNNGKKSFGAVWTIVLVVAVVLIIVSLVELIPVLLDYNKSEQNYRDLVEQYTEDAPEEDPDSTGGDEGTGEEGWASAAIDFDALKQINPDVIGWIRFDDTDAVAIDYPILHADDNETYLRTDLYGESHTAGSIFLEAANDPDFSDCYNIIYGHNMRNGTMFGTLKQYRRDEDFYSANQYFTIYTESAIYRYRIFAYEVVPDDSKIYTAGYAPDEEYQDLIDLMLSISIRDTGITPDITDKIVTLSTCTSAAEDERFVVHAVCVDQRDAG